MLLFRAGLIFVVLCTPVLACSVAPWPDESFSHFRKILEGADSVGFAVVDGVDRERWDADDSKPLFVQKLETWAAEGRKTRPEDQAIIDFAEATASLDVRLWLKPPDDDPGSNPPLHAGLVIDLLFPRAFGGQCHGLPATCPPDLASGEIVLVAIETVPDGDVQKVVYCHRVSEDDLGRAFRTKEEWAAAAIETKVLLFDEDWRRFFLETAKIERIDPLLEPYERSSDRPLGNTVPRPRPERP